MRAILCENDTLKVHIDTLSFDMIGLTEIDKQVNPIVDYFGNARGKVPANLSIKEADSPHDADIVVVADEFSGEIISKKRVYGSSMDVDPAVEYYALLNSAL